MGKIKKLSTILILCGVLLMAVPIGARLIYNNNATNIVPEDYEVVGMPVSSTQEEVAAPEEAAEPAVPDSQTPQTVIPPVVEEIKQIFLGSIEIDAIDLKLNIVEGVEPANLAAGIGHVPGTATLGTEGNSVLAGHRNSLHNEFFKHLDRLKEGDEIKITTANGTYNYIVSGQMVVQPEDVSVLLSTPDTYELTLITCTPIYIATQRLLITAYLTE